MGTPNGLNLLQQNRVQQRLTTADGLPDDFIRSLYSDRDGSLWIGTRHGLAHLAGGRFTSFSSMDGLGSDFIGAILRSGPLWVGTSGGLSRQLQDEAFTNYTVQQGLSNNTITAIAQDTAGTLWLGTNGGGLNRLRRGIIKGFPWGSQGLPGTIYGMLEDGSRHLWLSSKTGIYRVSIPQLNAYSSGAAIPVTAYGTADGMNIRECSGGSHPAAWKLSDGSLWFATLDGVSFIDPAHMPENHVPPPVAIEKVLVDDHARPLGEELHIPPGANRIEFQYAGLSFVAPQKVQYRYQLQGFDRDWIDAGNRRAAFYTNLPPGNYRFRVLAANNDGVWNTAGASFGLRMLPHYYQTWWFYSALALGCLLLGYLAYRWRVLQVEAQWGAVLRERGRLAREIHDTLAQGFVGISVQLEVLARLLAGSRETAPPKSALDQLDRARALVRASLADARTSIWDLRSEAGGAPKPPDDLPSRLSRHCTRIAGGSTAKVYLQVKGTYRPVEHKMEEELLRIGQEAVANAVRHAAATRIDVQLIYESAQVFLRVEDDGRGFTNPPGSSGPEGHYGIRGMRERAGGDRRLAGARKHARRGHAGSGRRAARMKAEKVDNMSDPIRIMIVEDHAVVRQGLVALLRTVPEFAIVAEAADGHEAIELFRRHQPDVTLMDLRLPRMNGVEAIAAIRVDFPQARIIVLTTFDGDEDIYRALQAGARGYLLKGMTGDELMEAIRSVYGGKSRIPASVAERLAERMSAPSLTGRETEVLQLIVGGNSNKEIAAALYISEATVKTHINSLLSKLGVSDRTQAATTALQRGIVHLD